MNHSTRISHRALSVIGFSLPSAYLLSFLFEGQVLYGLLDYHGVKPPGYIFATMVAVFAGLLSCWRLVRSPRAARGMMLGSIGVCLLSTVPFFFAPSPLWAGALTVSGYAGGCFLAAWGHFLKAFTPREHRIKTCADGLIYSNVLMIAVNLTVIHGSVFVGLGLSMFCLALGMAFIWYLPAGSETTWREVAPSRFQDSLNKPLMMLFVFVLVITINSGLMYQVMNPAFAHLAGLTSWYWAMPYIITIAVMRHLPLKTNRSQFLYLGIAMMVASFIGFMLLGRTAVDYLVVNALMLGACGVFDLFWWSILGEMLDYAENPVKVFGIGLSANVFGILLGGVLGFRVTALRIPGSEIAVIALTVVCVTLALMPSLNRQLLLLLKSHTYLAAYDRLTQPQQADIILKKKPLEELTVREHEVLEQILSGKSNREIAQALFISENTVKTHARNIFSKYDVGSRAELISTLLKNQGDA